ALQLLIIGKIGDAEAALSEHGLDAIASDDGARRKRHELFRCGRDDSGISHVRRIPPLASPATQSNRRPAERPKALPSARSLARSQFPTGRTVEFAKPGA